MTPHSNHNLKFWRKRDTNSLEFEVESRVDDLLY